MLDTKQIMKKPIIITHEGSNRIRTLGDWSLKTLETEMNKEMKTLETEGKIIQKIAVYVQDDNVNKFYRALIFYKEGLKKDGM